MIVKIASIADIHFGASNSLTTSLYENLRIYFIDFLKKDPPHILAICGDLFHTKLNLTSTEAVLANAFIKNLIDSFPDTYILLIQGTLTHDLNQLDLFNCFKSDKFRIYKTVTEDHMMGMDFLIIPEEYYESKDKAYGQYLNKSYDWVFGHGLFTFAGSYALHNVGKFNKITFTAEDFKNIKGRSVWGHVHVAMQNGINEYCGSFDCWKHGEEEHVKGFRYHEYDTDKRKCVKDEFIVNKGASSFISIDSSEFDTKDINKLTEQVRDKSNGVTSLRIKVTKTSELSKEEIDNLIAVCLNFPNVSLFREQKIVTKVSSKENEDAAKERQNRIKEYENLTFNQITIKYAKDVYGANISEEQIAEVLC